MNTKIVICTILLCAGFSYPQNWVLDHDFGGTVVQMQFLNSNTGFVTVQSNKNLTLWKTVDKGKTWDPLNTCILESQVEKSFFLFTSESTGYRAYFPDVKTHTALEKTTDEGYTWTFIGEYVITMKAVQPLITFTNPSTGYLLLDDRFSPYNIQIYKTTDGFETFSQVYDENPGGVNYPGHEFRHTDVVSYSDGTIAGVGYNIPGGYYTDFYKFAYSNGSFLASYDNENTYLRYLYCSLLNPNSDLRMLGTQSDAQLFSGTRLYYGAPNHGENSYVVDNQNYYWMVGGMSFSNASIGFITIDNKVKTTTNSGVNWSEDGTLNSSVNSSIAHHRVKSFGQVCYVAATSGFYVRKLQENLNTNFEGQSGYYSLSIDGEDYGTPSQQYIRGGTCAFYARPYIKSGNDTTARFYYWGGSLDGGMNYNNYNAYVVNSNSQINADYKSHLVSTTGEAIKYGNQVKAVRDTNGILNLAYESMGGIFYTRIKYNCQDKLKVEECISATSETGGGYATFGNYNPYLTEIRHNGQNGTIDGEKNMATVWEKREGNNIKIMYNQRNCTGPYPNWWGAAENLFTLESVPEGFKAFPKLSVNVVFTPDYYTQRFVPYLKPASGGNKKLVVHTIARFNVHRDLDLTLPGDIQEYAVAPIYPAVSPEGVTTWNACELHVAYRSNQSIVYRHWIVYLDHVEEFPGEYKEVSDNDASTIRASVDIALKNNSNNGPQTFNMQPVVTWQAYRNIRVVIERDGMPYELQVANYPIFVRQRISNTSWDPMTYSYIYPNVTQELPNIVGSKLDNSCLVNFTRNTTLHPTVVPFWHGYVNYVTENGQFTGTDARLINNSVINSSSIHDTLITLTQNNGLYSIGRQHFTVTNAPVESGPDIIYGVALNDNLSYSFNLGDIMVNWYAINFYEGQDTLIDDGSEFNEYLRSKNFLLSDNDTLVIGRNASYIPDEGSGTFQEIEYWVKLMNNSSGEMLSLLAHDTVHVGDSIHVEYLEGFVINGISGGSDSFYVQMEVDTLFIADGGYGIVSGQSGQGEGDNSVGKRYIFWNGVNYKTASSNLPTVFNLYQNYPNPFNPLTKIKFDLPKDVNVKIKVYDLLGREATMLVNEFKQAGWYELEWNATNYASGVYIYRIEAGDYVKVKKMVLIK